MWLKTKWIAWLMASVVLSFTGYTTVAAADAPATGRPLKGYSAIYGELLAQDDGVLTIRSEQTGLELTVQTTADVTVRIIGQSEATLMDLVPGDQVLARGEYTAEGAFLAGAVTRVPTGDHAWGRMTTLEGDSLTLTRANGESVSVVLQPDTLVVRGPFEETWSEVSVNPPLGLPVLAFGDLDGATLQAHTLVVARPAHFLSARALTGVIEALEGDGFTLAVGESGQVEVVTTDQTRYWQAGARVDDVTSFAVGDEVALWGVWSDVDTFTARVVASELSGQFFVGTVEAIEGQELTLSTRWRGSLTLVVNDMTIYRVGWNRGADLADFAPGDVVVVHGALDADGTTVTVEQIVKRAGFGRP